MSTEEEPTLAMIPSEDPDRIFILEVVDMPEDLGPMYFMALEGHPGFTHSVLRAVLYSSREEADKQLEWTIQNDLIDNLPPALKTPKTRLKVKELKFYTEDPDTREIVTPGVTSGYVN